MVETVPPLSESLERNARWLREKTAVRQVDADRSLTYGDLDDRASALAAALAERGLRRGDRVVFALYNTLELPVTLYGCHKRGLVPVAVNCGLSAGDFAYIFEEIRPAAVVYDADLTATVEAAVEGLARSPHRVVVGDAASNDTRFGRLLDEGASTSAEPVAVPPDEIAYMFYTSGTTGHPKAVAHSTASGRDRTHTGITSGRMHRETMCLSLLPLFHGGGLDSALRASVTVGGTLLVGEDLDVGDALDAIERYGVTDVRSVPTLTQRFVDREDIDARDLSTVESWRLTGGVLTDRAATAFTETLTPNVFNAYGSSESGTNAILQPEDLPEHAGSVGKPTLGDEIRVIEYDPDRVVGPEETVPDGTRGEVVVRTAQLFRGYYENEAESAARVHDGWYYTHDMGVVDDGYLTIVGRCDNHVLSGGELVSAVEVEAVIESHDAVSAAVVVGTPDDEWGERVTAFVATGGSVSEADLDTFCRETDRLADYKRPRTYHFVDEVRLTDTGKKARSHYEAVARGDGPDA